MLISLILSNYSILRLCNTYTSMAERGIITSSCCYLDNLVLEVLLDSMSLHMYHEPTDL